MRAPRGGGGGWKMAAGGGSAGRPCAAWLLIAAALTAVQVSAVEVNTPEEMFVENGTDAKLPCTFTSVEVISSAASVSWSFQPEGAATRISFFYYSNGKSYPGKDIPFKDRITWAGDLNKKDASITISNMQFRDNGTYICDVKNPPDIVVKPGEIRVRVVEKGIHSPYLHAGFSILGHLEENLSDSKWGPVFETLLTIGKDTAPLVFRFLGRLKVGFQAFLIGCNSS
ncbi:myelin protein zero-like protein 1 isoform X6 [Hirundo rustica]|uniref:myelin protein zero-like protein 1 isoform X6 n=1 Tax=Hirundo rustica TaxID=43150 RepID=UPI0026731725|nr:myelin protein zero-like protein 1 isoform X6 [Hirundo rustica]